MVEDDAPDGALLTAAEAVEQRIIHTNAHIPGEDRDADPGPPSIWQLRRLQRLTNGGEFVRTMLGFGDDDDERAEGRADGEGDTEGEGESDEDEPPARGSRRRNRFISHQCPVSKKRRD